MTYYCVEAIPAQPDQSAIPHPTSNIVEVPYVDGNCLVKENFNPAKVIYQMVIFTIYGILKLKAQASDSREMIRTTK